MEMNVGCFYEVTFLYYFLLNHIVQHSCFKWHKLVAKLNIPVLTVCSLYVKLNDL